MGLEPIRANAQFGSISTCQISHELDGSVVHSCILPILRLQSERTEQQYQFCLEADTMYMGELQAVSSHIGSDVTLSK